MGNLHVITIAIIAINIIVSLKGFSDFSFFEKYKFNIGGIKRGEQIRMLSSAFLHVDQMHLFFNMFTLYFFADEVISYLGPVQFLLVYFGSLIVGNLLSFYFHKDEYHYSAVGASGAVTGVLYSAILLEPNMGLYLMFLPIAIPGYIFGIGYLLYSIYGMKNRIGNIGHDAHFGGAIGGYIITLITATWIFEEHLQMVILLAIPIVLLYVLRRLGKI
ncbi:MAG: rhomboid family intramembrane serine protease [Bacteroidia bacterium]|nr:rhomboid family intramembrane serine protease [Bacteroidia bacterium]NND26771.1 rhomboid family intramembrane serine protease [Flavobacteriaceae bacterium]MBT8278175.1 rhomboid family intramembrane serine protease [Bacteroidia bacterium]NNK61303.1 rhomboid family intramembrane serine protease [Flavobacteriaceae bacterium]NNL32521.1 rhomboid family intramembrane serine protease [Flavobacteriaceae bacterium]